MKAMFRLWELRVLSGDRYDQTITEWCAGEDGPETYEWDTGIAP